VRKSLTNVFLITVYMIINKLFMLYAY